MTYQKAKEEIIESSPQKTDAGKEELYLYSLRKMAEENVENNRTGLTNLHNINSFFYLCGEMIRQQPDKKYSVIIMDIVQFKAVNEFCGRDEGDRLLRFIASCFDWYENNRPDSYACHIRADIFCLCTSYEEVEELETGWITAGASTPLWPWMPPLPSACPNWKTSISAAAS